MKTLGSALASHIAGEVTSLATCWALKRRDGTEMFFTDFDRDLTVEGDLYRAASGYSRSAIVSDGRFSVDNLDLIGALMSEAITEEDLLAGRYDFAEMRIFMVNWQDPAMGKIALRRGWIGEVSSRDGGFTAELRGLAQGLLYEVGEVYSPLCPADLGDDRCTVDIEALTETDSVAAVTSQSEIVLTGYSGADGILNGGVLTFTSGENAGISAEIRDWQQAGKALTLFLAMPFTITAGDAVTITPGCDKRLVTCREKFANHVNFRGHPHIPGTDALIGGGHG